MNSKRNTEEFGHFANLESANKKLKMNKRNWDDKAGPSTNTSPSNGSGFLFDAFLSFRGTDTRKGFTSHLYKELKRSGAISFIDSEELQKGERIDQLLKYMESSQLFVPILSKDYAKSKWCLLEAAKMVEICEGGQQKQRQIIPVFYYVEPSDVKDDGGLYHSAVIQLQNEGKLEGETMKRCIDALKTLGRISGFSLTEGTNESEAKHITCLCKRIRELIGRVPFGVQPIGIDSQIVEVINMLGAHVNGVCIIGICGMGGMGKTTIAKAIYDKLYSEFDGGSFIQDIREMAERKGLPSVQEKLIRDVLKKKSVSIDTIDEGCNIIKQRLGGKRLLIILDNIVNLDQLRALSGDYTCHKPEDLFGAGSKIVVTTRDEAILHSYGNTHHQIYFPQELKHPWSLKLFHRHAFMDEPPSSVLLKLAEEATGIAGGIPLVLEVFGKVFAGLRTTEKWNNKLKRLRKNLPEDVLKKLRWSYDELDNDEKNVFLDIACFFVGAKRKYVAYLWDDYAFEDIIDVLQQRSLLSMDDEERFRMHDRIQEMGRWIAGSEGKSDNFMNKRLCCRNEQPIMSMHAEQKKIVEGIVLNMEEESTITNLSTKEFEGMYKLRLLHLNFVNFKEHPDFNHFPKKLKWLRWKGCELESVVLYGRSFGNLVIIDLSNSNISHLQLHKLNRLKVLDLSSCGNIQTTPDFSCTPNLERLILDYCSKLRDIHESVCHLESLTTWSMRDCEFVKKLPEKHRCSISNLSKLEALNLQGCKQLQSLPRLPSSLKELFLQGCQMLESFHGFENLESIELLGMDECKGINYSLMRRLFEGKTFTYLEELSISTHECKIVVPLCSPRSPLLLEHLQFYGEWTKSSNLSNVSNLSYIKLCVKDMDDKQVIYETILSAHRDICNEIGDNLLYTVSVSEYHDINFLSCLSGPCLIWISTTDGFCLERVDILLRSAKRQNRNSSKLINAVDRQANLVEAPNPTFGFSTLEFDVLFSYTEEDVDTNFIHNLCKVLENHDIYGVFKGKDGENKGEKVDELVKCIKSSVICIPIFSNHFCESARCLTSVAKMVELKKPIIPIYFHVDPSDIRNQMKEYSGICFCNHEDEKQRESIVEDWIKALQFAVGQYHHPFIYETYRNMEELITVVRDRISSTLNSVVFSLPPTWIGSRVNGVMRILEKEDDDNGVVGICGQSGIGKTTIAKALYGQLFHKSHSSAFIADVGALARTDKGRASLHKKLAMFDYESRRGMLAIFDDADGLDKSEKWRIRRLYGKGMKTVIIAEDKKDLTSYRVRDENIYFAPELSNNQSLRLFAYHAFKGKQPTAEIRQLVSKATRFAGGLPLALAVLGSLFSGMTTKSDWESILEKLSSAPGEGADKILEVSIDALLPHEQQLFFDIASEKECPSAMWKGIICSPGSTIKLLEQSCLISINGEGRPTVHGLIRDWRRRWTLQQLFKCSTPMITDCSDIHLQKIFLDIACCLIGCEKEYATYMWEDCGYSPTHAIKVLEDKSFITVNKQGMFKMDDCIRDAGISMMKKDGLNSCKHSRHWKENELLQTLGHEKHWNDNRIEGINVCHGHLLQRRFVVIEAMGNLRLLHLTYCHFRYTCLRPGLKNLRWLRLEGCSVDSRVLCEGNIVPNLLVLQLNRCRMVETMTNDKHEEGFPKLKVLEIGGCDEVETAFLNFSSMRSLLKLVIERCYTLEMNEIIKSIGGLTMLECLRIRNCNGLERLHSSIGNLSSLQILDIEGCESLLELSERLGDLAALRKLVLSGCPLLKELPNSIIKLNHLQNFKICNCATIQCLPQLPCSLQILEVEKCQGLLELPETLGDLADLRKLVLSRCWSLKEISNSIIKLEHLQTFDIGYCDSIQRLPQLPCSLQTLTVSGCKGLLELPETLGDLADLRDLFLSGCSSLKEIPNSISKLNCLQTLSVTNCHSLEEIPDSIFKQKHLQTLIISYCQSLRHLPQLPSSLITLDASRCGNLIKMAGISCLQDLKTLNLYGCEKLASIPGIQDLKSLSFSRLPFHVSQSEKI